jgi:hypothetical protein
METIKKQILFNYQYITLSYYDIKLFIFCYVCFAFDALIFSS